MNHLDYLIFHFRFSFIFIHDIIYKLRLCILLLFNLFLFHLNATKMDHQRIKLKEDVKT